MEPFAGRVKRFERRMTEEGADAALLSTGPNLYYLSGFYGEHDRNVVLLLTAEGERTFVSPAAYVGQVRDNSWISEVRSVPRNHADDVADGLAESWSRPDGRLLLDDSMSVGLVHRIEDRLPEASFGLANELLVPMRMRKDEGEIEALRRAAHLTDEVSEEIRAMGTEVLGMTESELTVEIRARLHRKGGERLSFPVTVAAGPNGAQPTQYRHGDREIRTGEPVVLDFGAFFDHYPSDQTRTVVFDGEPPEKFIDIHGIVEEALQTGVRAVEPGMTASELDQLVRNVIDEAGYGEQFTTGTGHGVGLRAHEPPSIGPEDDTVLDPGMVFSIEPGIYIEGEFGVRLETLVAISEAGTEVLNTSPYGWEPC